MNSLKQLVFTVDTDCVACTVCNMQFVYYLREIQNLTFSLVTEILLFCLNAELSMAVSTCFVLKLNILHICKEICG
jgi:hypothetical protein